MINIGGIVEVKVNLSVFVWLYTIFDNITGTHRWIIGAKLVFSCACTVTQNSNPLPLFPAIKLQHMILTVCFESCMNLKKYPPKKPQCSMCVQFESDDWDHTP